MYSAMGAGFTFLSLKMNRFRKTYIEPKKWLRILEPVLIVFIMSLISGEQKIIFLFFEFKYLTVLTYYLFFA